MRRVVGLVCCPTTVDGGSSSNDGGSSSNDSGGPDLGDFPIAAPPFGEAAPPFQGEDLWAYTVTFPADRVDEVMAFYDEWTSSQPDEYQRVEASSGGVVYSATVGDELYQITVSAPIEGDNVTFVTLGVANPG